MATLTINTIDVLGQAVSLPVSITLCDVNKNTVSGYSAAGVSVTSYSGVTNASGILAVDLIPNSTIQPVNSLYLVDIGGREFLIIKSVNTQTLYEALAATPTELTAGVVLQGAAGVGGALGYYGAFQDTTTQTIASTTTAYPITFNTTDESNGVSRGTPTSRIVIGNTGTYNFQWSGQFVNNDNTDQDIDVWVRKNGVDIAGTTGRVSVPARHGSTDGHIIAGWNFVFSAVANDYFELVWRSSSTAVTLATFAAGTSPTRPSTASVVATVTQVMYLQGSYTDNGAVNVMDFGAIGNGVADDTAAIQNAINACPSGGIVKLPAKTFKVSSPIILKPTITLEGTHGNRIFYDSAPVGTPQPSMIKASSTFSGSAIIRMLDKEEGGYSEESTGQRINNLTIDGSALTSGTIRGIYATGRVREVIIHNVAVQFMPNNGIATGSYTRADSSVLLPYSWYVTETIARSCGNYGFSIGGMTDSNFISCQSLDAGISGWFITSAANTVLTNCRSEWSGQHGFYVTGSWGSYPNGSGGAVFTGCTTDRNNYNGFFVDATGATPMLFNGCSARRDGRNGNSGGGSYAGFKATSATLPILIDSFVNYPGNNDDGVGTVSPQYGASFTGNTYVSISGASFLHGVTAGFHNGGTNTVLRRGPNIGERTGSTSSAVNVYSNSWAMDNGSNLTTNGTISATSFISQGGTSLQFVKGDGSLDSTILDVPSPQNIPVANSGQTLATALTAVTGGFAVVGQSLWTIPAGRTLQARVVGVFSGHTSGDILGIDFYDLIGAASVIPEATLATSGVNPQRVVTGWVNVPATAWQGNVRVRNSTAARGVSRQCWLEFKFI